METATLAAGESSRLHSMVQERFYRPELDVLRFVAFLLVLLNHTWLVPEGSALKLHIMRSLSHAGGCGVPLFFLLSAYLITELLLREKESKGDVNIGAFYVRRILRIWPLYFLMLFLVYGFGVAIPAFRIPLAEVAAYLLLAGNWYAVLHGLMISFGYPLWSICVEEQFYLVWPSLVRYATRRNIAAVSLLLWLTCQVSVFALSLRGVKILPVMWPNSLVHLQYFALGALLSLALRGRVLRISWIARAGLLALGAFLFFAADFFCGALTISARTGYLTMPGFLLVGAGAVSVFLGTIGASLPSLGKPFVYLGKISYGLYIYHALCLVVGDAFAGRVLHRHDHPALAVCAVAIPLTILISAASYRFFETPFLKIKERFAVVHTRDI